MLRYDKRSETDRQTKPGLVALYDIRPANGAGQFLQPHSTNCFHHRYHHNIEYYNLC